MFALLSWVVGGLQALLALGGMRDPRSGNSPLGWWMRLSHEYQSCPPSLENPHVPLFLHHGPLGYCVVSLFCELSVPPEAGLKSGGVQTLPTPPPTLADPPFLPPPGPNPAPEASASGERGQRPCVEVTEEGALCVFSLERGISLSGSVPPPPPSHLEAQTPRPPASHGDGGWEMSSRVRRSPGLPCQHQSPLSVRLCVGAWLSGYTG